MDGLSDAAAILQVLGYATSVAIKTAKLVNNVKNAARFKDEALQSLLRCQQTVEIVTKQLGNRQIPINEEGRIKKLATEVAEDCQKCNRSLKELYDVRLDSFGKKVKEGIKSEIRKSQLESINARFRANVGNIQLLLSSLQLIISEHQAARTERMEDVLQDVQVKIECLEGLRKDVATALNKLHHGDENTGNLADSVSGNRLGNEAALRQDAEACIETTKETLITANSLYERHSGSGSERTLSGPIGLLVENMSLPLSQTTTFLDNYIYDAYKEYDHGEFEKSKRYLYEAIKWGERRHAKYETGFQEWFDLQFKLADVFQKQEKFEEARKVLVYISQSPDTETPDYRMLPELRQVQLYGAIARLNFHEYQKTRNITLEDLEIAARRAYGAALKAYDDALNLKEEPRSIDPTLQRLFVDSASILDAVYELLGDPVGRRSLRYGYPFLESELPTIDSVPQAHPVADLDAPSRHPSLPLRSASETTLPKPLLSVSGSSDILATSPPSSETNTTQYSSLRDPLNLQGSSLSNGDGERKSLCVAAEIGSEAFKKALRNGAVEIEERNAAELTPLLIAAKKGNRELMELILSEYANVNVNALDVNKMNALHHSLTAMGGNEVVELLISKGIDVNAPDCNGDTPLHYCVQRDNLQAARLLFSTGNVRVDTPNDLGRTPAQLLARQNGMLNMRMLKLLVEYKADFNWPDITREMRHVLRKLGCKTLLSRSPPSVASKSDRGRRDSLVSQSSVSSQQSKWEGRLSMIGQKQRGTTCEEEKYQM